VRQIPAFTAPVCIPKSIQRQASLASTQIGTMPRDKKDKKLSEGDKAIVAKVGVDNTFRRTWDKEEFTAKADEREKKVSCCYSLQCPRSLPEALSTMRFMLLTMAAPDGVYM